MTTRAAPPGQMHPPANSTPPSQRLDDARALGLTLSQARAGGLSAAVVWLAHHPKSWYYHLPAGITKRMTTTVTTKGQVTIPKAVREHLGIAPGSEVDFELLPDRRIAIVKHGAPPPESFFARFIGHAGPGMTTNELMALLRGDA